MVTGRGRTSWSTMEKGHKNLKTTRKSKSPLSNILSGASMSTLDLIAVVESGVIDLNESATMASVPYWQVCMKANHLTTKSLQIKDLKNFISPRNGNFYYWWNRPDGYSSNSCQEVTTADTVNNSGRKPAPVNKISGILRKQLANRARHKELETSKRLLWVAVTKVHEQVRLHQWQPVHKTNRRG